VSRRRLDAWLLLDKPGGISSNAALQRAKRLYGAAKAGHAGTLDPLASGLLPVLFGEATKFSGFLLDAEKGYLADVRLGVTTATGDAEGEVLQRRPVQVADEQLHQALARLRGAIEQVPPMYSALKHRGRPLYELARQGTEIERAARRVVISELELLARRGDVLSLRIRCSKGTYIRSLAMDLGTALGTGAHLTALRRTAAGGYGVAEAVTLDALEVMDEPARERLLLAPQALLRDLPRVALDTEAARRFANGQAVAGRGGPSGRWQVFDDTGRLLGVGTLDPGGELRPVRLVAQAAESPALRAEAGKTL